MDIVAEINKMKRLELGEDEREMVKIIQCRDNRDCQSPSIKNKTP